MLVKLLDYDGGGGKHLYTCEPQRNGHWSFTLLGKVEKRIEGIVRNRKGYSFHLLTKVLPRPGC